jgi:hypothetical protein
MALLARYRLTLGIVAAALAATGGIFLFAKPEYGSTRGVTIKLPAKQPAADASGAAGWAWPGGTPGWPAGYTIKGYNVSGVQPVELQAAELAAARRGLDSTAVRVLVSSRPGTDGVLAIVAAQMLYEAEPRTCLAAILEGTASVTWRCADGTRSRNDLAQSRVLVAAAETRRGALYLVGVARGDVYRVVLVAPRRERIELYARGTTWGQFEAAVSGVRSASLQVFGRRGLAQTVPLRLPPGSQRVLP